MLLEIKREKKKDKAREQGRGHIAMLAEAERIKRVMQKRHISNPVKPHVKKCQILVHPKDQTLPK